MPSDPAPLRTDVQTKLAGNCSTQFDIVISLQADADPATTFNPLQPNRMTAVRRLDGSAIAKLAVTDVSPFIGAAAYDETCRVWLEIAFNHHD
jgi:hypothetical protein